MATRSAAAPMASWMRTISLGKMLTSKVMLTRPDALPKCEQAILYELSEMSEKSDFFFSHSWASSGYKKHLSVTWYGFGVQAVISGVVGTMLMLLFELHVFEIPGIVFEEPVSGARIKMDIPAYFIGLMMMWAFLLILPWLRCQGGGFLDAACVHQTDAHLKRDGISKVAQYIKASNDFLVALDQNYFSRGWCVYEFAIAQASQKSIKAMPLNLYALMTAQHIYYAIGYLICSVIIPFMAIFGELGSWLSILVSEIACCTIDAAIADWLAQQQRSLRSQLSKFEMQSMAFTAEADREYVLDSIHGIYGDIETFNTLVRTTVKTWALDQFENQRAVLPYSMALMCHITALLMFAGQQLSLRSDPVELQLSYLLAIVNIVFCISPSGSAISMLLGKLWSGHKGSERLVTMWIIPIGSRHIMAGLMASSYISLADYASFKLCGIASGKLDWIGNPWQGVIACFCFLTLNASIAAYVYMPRSVPNDGGSDDSLESSELVSPLLN